MASRFNALALAAALLGVACAGTGSEQEAAAEAQSTAAATTTGESAVAGAAVESSTTSVVEFTTTVAPTGDDDGDDEADEIRSQRTYVRDLTAPGLPGVPGSLVTMTATPSRAEFVISTSGFEAGHALTAWIIVLDNTACIPAFPALKPCQPWFLTALDRPDLGNVRHLSGGVTDADGAVVMTGSVTADTVTGGDESRWWYETPIPGFTDALFHVSIHDHGPVIEDQVQDMTGTYRGGCTDESALAEAGLPDIAFMDGRPGPNTCTNPQAAPLEPGVDFEEPPPPIEFIEGSVSVEPPTVPVAGVYDLTVSGVGFRRSSELLIMDCTAPGPALVPGVADVDAISAAIFGIRGLHDCRIGESVPVSVGTDGTFEAAVPMEVRGTPDASFPEGTNYVIIAFDLEQSQVGATWLPVVASG